MKSKQQPSKQVPQSYSSDPRSMYVELRSVHTNACSNLYQASLGCSPARHVTRPPMSLRHVCRSGWTRRTRTAPGGRACPSCPPPAAASSPPTELSWSTRGTSGRPSPATSPRPWSEADAKFKPWLHVFNWQHACCTLDSALPRPRARGVKLWSNVAQWAACMLTSWTQPCHRLWSEAASCGFSLTCSTGSIHAVLLCPARPGPGTCGAEAVPDVAQAAVCALHSWTLHCRVPASMDSWPYVLCS